MYIILIICFVLVQVDSMGTYVNLADKKIPEEIAIGSLISDLSEQSTLVKHDSETHYTFLDDIKTSIENMYFLLDGVTGRLTSKRYLDRESMCLNKHCSNSCLPNGNCAIDVKILQIPAYTIFKFRVEIEDINDNKPYFSSGYQVQKIAEDVAIGHMIPIEPAYDPDFGLNSVQSYRLLDKHVPFELVLDESLALKVTQQLDRESVASYNLTIEACDAGKPSHCAQALIHISLIDVNDNKPKFEQQSYQFKVSENELNSSTIGFVRAVDLDQGANSLIKYSLINNPGNYFSLDENTGELKLIKWFDYEKEKYFSLNIEAKDLGLRSLQAYTNVEILVQDLNDNKPDISVSFLSEFYRNETNGHVSVYIEENLESNKFLAHVQIQDKDKVSASCLEWNVFLNDKELKLPSILENDRNYFKINKLNSESFTLSTGSRNLDREIEARINVSIRATDQMNIVFYNFTIELLDENDNAPMLDKQSFDLNINENNYVDQLIHKFEASDPDFGQNGMLIYTLEPSVDFVYIEPLTGYLRASKVFDRELKSLYEFYIVVRDNPANFSLSKSTKAKCRLNIIDLNDNKPFIVYKSKLYKNITLRVEENLPLNTQIASLKCIDKDSSSKVLLFLNDKLNFYNSNELTSRLPFRIAPNGSLTNIMQLDREEQDMYEFEIVCTDSKYNASLNVTVYVNDLNDNCPRSLHKKEENVKFVNMLNLSSSDLVFSEMYIDDDDLGQNSDIKFELIDYKDRISLNVSKMADKIYQISLGVLNSSLFSQIGRYPIRLRAWDAGEPSCEIIESFILLVGNNEYSNRSLLMERLQKFAFVHMPLLNGSRVVFMVVLFGFFVSMTTFLFILLLVFVCKKNRLNKKRREIDGLKVRNYRLMEAVKLEASNRFSLSTDQSGDSVASNTTKETTSPSPSSKSAQQMTFYELTSFQKTNLVRVSDYSTGSSETGECNEMNDLTSKQKQLTYNDVEIFSQEERVPCLVDLYKSSNYAHYIRSSIV